MNEQDMNILRAMGEVGEKAAREITLLSGELVLSQEAEQAATKNKNVLWEECTNLSIDIAAARKAALYWQGMYERERDLYDTLNNKSCDADIIRRIAERGMKMAHETGAAFVDVFQHILDELHRFSPEKMEADLSCTADWIGRKLDVADDGVAAAGQPKCTRHEIENCVSCRRS